MATSMSRMRATSAKGHVESVVQDEGNALSGSKSVQDDEGSKTILFLPHDVLERIGCR